MSDVNFNPEVGGVQLKRVISNLEEQIEHLEKQLDHLYATLEGLHIDLRLTKKANEIANETIEALTRRDLP